MQGALDTRAKLASPARKEDEERDEKGSQKLIGRLDRSHQQLFQQHRSQAAGLTEAADPPMSALPPIATKAVVVVVARLQCALHVGACCNDGIMDTHSPQNLQGCPAYVDFIAPFQ